METRHSGLLFPSKGPIFLPTFPANKLKTNFWRFSSIWESLPAVLVNPPGYRNIQVPQHVLHFRFPQS